MQSNHKLSECEITVYAPMLVTTIEVDEGAVIS